MEKTRLAEARDKKLQWKKWGPYLSERQWGTVREDYSENGDAWNFFTHDHARSRAYRWGEDGIAGISDDKQRLCFALALWNGKDPILKERFFGLTNSQGNHGEDVKEYYFYVDNTPTHSYMKLLYKYPQGAYPYADLIEQNGRRSREEMEYELLDTGIFNEDRYFDVFVEYAKAGPEDILVRISAVNRGPAPSELHLLPTLWFRNNWSAWIAESNRATEKPNLSQVKTGPVISSLKATHSLLGEFILSCEGEVPLLFTENETNHERLFPGTKNESPHVKDGINALNTAFLHGGVFIQAKRGRVVEHPIYIYNVVDGRSANIFAQPRSLVHVDEQAQVQLVETYATLGAGESFTNQVVEVVVEQGAILEYYKIQNDKEHTNQVSTTHIRQLGKSHIHTVTISLSGRIVRNNLNVILEAERCEAHLYGLYFHQGQSHIDNHTVVDNVKPHCLSNELYKGILNDNATGVFNGKIFVRQQAQKTNAYQSNKNVLLSDNSSVNTKPQLEIFADDVKCSHGCTVGRLNEEGLFYLRSRGISEKVARSLLLQAFAADILEHVKPEPIRIHIERLIAERLEFV